MQPAGAELLAAVERSPQAAAAHDRAAWVGLFTGDGRIDDPVGSRPHIGGQQIGRFYDTFIDRRQITFHPDVDVVAGTTVVRDLTLEVAMGSSVTVMIPAVLRYDLRSTDDGWRIARLRAYWELPTMIRQFLGHGAVSLPASLQLSSALLRNQGLGGTAGFLQGLPGPRRRAKRRVRELLNALGVAGRGKLIAVAHSVAAPVTTPTGPGILIANVDCRGRRIIAHNLFTDSRPTPHHANSVGLH
ncbi:MAG: nuclear transport factor 2 family protein [Mycobacteriaceae bacterium]|nr:nuclear transport factor 2 family protein [Mycobacteriaceae bacterium]